MTAGGSDMNRYLSQLALPLLLVSLTLSCSGEQFRGEDRWLVHPEVTSYNFSPNEAPYAFEGSTPLAVGARVRLQAKVWDTFGYTGGYKFLSVQVDGAETDDPDVARPEDIVTAEFSDELGHFTLVGIAPGETEVEVETTNHGWIDADVRVELMERLIFESLEGEGNCLEEGGVALVGQQIHTRVAALSASDRLLHSEGLDFVRELDGEDLLSLEHSETGWHAPPDQVYTTYRATAPGTTRFSIRGEPGGRERRLRVVELADIDRIEILQRFRPGDGLTAEVLAYSDGQPLCSNRWLDESVDIRVELPSDSTCWFVRTVRGELRFGGTPRYNPDTCTYTVTLGGGSGASATASYPEEEPS